MKFNYAAEKFWDARRVLMLPHPGGEEEDIAAAFHECTLGLNNVRDEDLDGSAQVWVSRLRELMDTSALRGEGDTGLWVLKAQRLSPDERCEVSNLVDELAHWFDTRKD